MIGNYNYNKPLYESHPTKYSDILNNKYNIVHDQLYNSALISAYNDMFDYVQNEYNLNHEDKIQLTNYKDYKIDISYLCKVEQDNDELILTPDINEFKKHVNIIELTGKEYWIPSQVIFKLKHYPFLVISPNYSNEFKINNKQLWSSTAPGKLSLRYWWNNYTYIDDVLKEKYEKYQIVYLDYVKGIATLENKNYGDKIEISFNDIYGNMEVSDEYSLKNTFGYLIR